jgi:hypothetical protein
MARGPAALGGAGRKGIGRGESLGTTQGRAQDPNSADLRELDRCHARLIQNLRRVYAHGPRVSGELAIELAITVDALPIFEEARPAFRRQVNPDFLRAIGCDDFPHPPIRVVGGRR